MSRGGGLDENWDVRVMEVWESAVVAEIVEKTHGIKSDKESWRVLGVVLRSEPL